MEKSEVPICTHRSPEDCGYATKDGQCTKFLTKCDARQWLNLDTYEAEVELKELLDRKTEH